MLFLVEILTFLVWTHFFSVGSIRYLLGDEYMRLSKNFELVDIAGECLLIPIGEKTKEKRDMFTFSNAGTFLIRLLKDQRTEEELSDYLADEYAISRQKATKEVDQFINQLIEFEIVEE